MFSLKALPCFLAAIYLWGPVVQANGDMETILGFKTDKSGVYFQVRSNGCTGKDDFRVESEKGDSLLITLKRVNPDQCSLKVPYGNLIKFNYKELGLKDGMKFTLVNQLDSEPRIVVKPSAD